MTNEPMMLIPAKDLGRAMMVARELLGVAYDYVDRWGERCLNDRETPAFIRSIYAQKGLNAVRKAG